MFAAVVALSGATPAAAQDDVEVPEAPQPTGLGIRLLDVPVDAADNPRAQNYVIDHVAPGATLTRRFVVSNGGSGPFAALIYPTEARINANRFVPAPGQRQNDLASWITVDQPRVDLGDIDSEIVTLTIDVPVDAPDGEHYAVVFAERPPAADGREVGIAARVGIRIYLSVGTGSAPATDFEIDSMIAGRSQAGEAVVVTTITNTGGRAIDVSGDITLSNGPEGRRAGPVQIPTGTTVAPGEVGTVEAVFDPDLADGPWLAQVRLRSGLVELSARAVISFPPMATSVPRTFEIEEPVVERTEAREPVNDRPWPTWWVVAGLVLLAGLLAARLRYRSAARSEGALVSAPTKRNPDLRTATVDATGETSTAVAPVAAPFADPTPTTALLSSKECVEAIAGRLPFAFSVTTHATVARNLEIRPPAGEPHRSLNEDYCRYDRTTRKFGYTRRWVNRVVDELSTVEGYRAATGREPQIRSRQPRRPVS